MHNAHVHAEDVSLDLGHWALVIHWSLVIGHWSFFSALVPALERQLGNARFVQFA